jgi:hypothetical protein
MTTTEKSERPYVAFYKNQRAEVWATSSYAAQTKAAALLKARKQYDVSVYLADVPISTASL